MHYAKPLASDGGGSSSSGNVTASCLGPAACQHLLLLACQRHDRTDRRHLGMKLCEGVRERKSEERRRTTTRTLDQPV